MFMQRVNVQHVIAVVNLKFVTVQSCHSLLQNVFTYIYTYLEIQAQC
jgi:hypothetical protein